MSDIATRAHAREVVAKSPPIRVIPGEASVTMTPGVAEVIRAAIDEQRAREGGSKV